MAFFDLLPDAIAHEGGAAVMPWVLFGFVVLSERVTRQCAAYQTASFAGKRH